jgi:hypothetical protein
MKTALSAVKMETLAMDVHMVWMKEMSGLMTSAGAIAATQDIELEIFIPFSKSIYELLKVAMKCLFTYSFVQWQMGEGANWLSKENAVKNPFMVLKC